MFKIDSGNGKFKIEIDDAPIVFYYAILLTLKALAKKKGHDEEGLVELFAKLLSDQGLAEKAVELLRKDVQEDEDDNEDLLF